MNFDEGLALSHRAGSHLCEINGAACVGCLREDCASARKNYSVVAAPQAFMETSTDKVNKTVPPAFEDVLHVIDPRGKFQTRMNIIFCYVGSLFVAMSSHVYYIAMQTPDHWCHVPGRENTSLSREEWKNITIPKFGRRPQVILCVSATVASRVMLVFTPSVLALFILAQSLAAGAAGPFFESVASVGVELTDIRHRSSINRNSWISICIGVVSGGLVAWMFGNWQHFLLFTAFCCFLLLLFIRWFPESPRWLACRGREQEALAAISRIAATNGRSSPAFTQQVLRRLARARRERRGFLSICSSWNLFKNTAILVISRSIMSLTVFALMLSVGILDVQPFVTVSVQGLAQLVAILLVHCYISRIGRRWTSAAALLLSGCISVGITQLIYIGAPGAALMAAVAVLQFVTTTAGATANLQSLEVHPTCLRQITGGIEMAVAGLVLSLVPYVVFTGGSVDQRLPFLIIAGISVMAAVLMSFLPESALQKLPETLEDAAAFGRGQPYWSWRPRPEASFLSEE